MSRDLAPESTTEQAESIGPPSTDLSERVLGLKPSRAVALGLLLLQLAWLLAVPPFRGLDEFDHVYKAAAVARGDWIPTPADATRGTGAWLEVPSDLVRAARAQCESLPYTDDVDCVGTPRGSTTRVASGAGRYTPLYYAAVGTPALPFKGVAAVYVMRIASLLMCWLLFCAALWTTRQWARTHWPTTAIAIASTPVLIYSSTVVAPNGIEMMAGFVLWSALLGLATDRAPHARVPLLVMSALAASILATTRSLGPLLCLLVLASALQATRPPRDVVTTLLRRRLTWAMGAVVVAAAAANTAWVLGLDPLNIGQKLVTDLSAAARMRYLLSDIPLWVLQSVAAFPARDEPTRPEVYVCFLALFGALTVLGFRCRERHLFSAAVVAFIVSLAFPLALSAQPGSNPTIWQGRYMLPYTVGIALLLGLALDRHLVRLSSRLRTIGLGLYVVGQVVGPLQVLHKTIGKHLSDEDAFIHFSPWLVGAVAAFGAAALWWAATQAYADARVRREPPSP